mgnify:CR=1 FL=1
MSILSEFNDKLSTFKSTFDSVNNSFTSVGEKLGLGGFKTAKKISGNTSPTQDDLSGFISNLHRGVVKGNHFKVEFKFRDLNGKRGIPGLGGDTNELRVVQMYCDSVQFPGTNISTIDAKVQGETRAMPYERLYDLVHMQFILDAKLGAKKMFDAWEDMIIDRNTKIVGYAKDYKCDIEISLLDASNNQPIYTVTLIDAFPKIIGTIDVNNAPMQGVVKLPVTFTFTKTKYEYKDSGNAEKMGNKELPSSKVRIEKVIPQYLPRSVGKWFDYF